MWKLLSETQIWCLRQLGSNRFQLIEILRAIWQSADAEKHASVEIANSQMFAKQLAKKSAKQCAKSQGIGKTIIRRTRTTHRLMITTRTRLRTLAMCHRIWFRHLGLTHGEHSEFAAADQLQRRTPPDKNATPSPSDNSSGFIWKPLDNSNSPAQNIPPSTLRDWRPLDERLKDSGLDNLRLSQNHSKDSPDCANWQRSARYASAGLVHHRCIPNWRNGSNRVKLAPRLAVTRRFVSKSLANYSGVFCPSSPTIVSKNSFVGYPLLCQPVGISNLDPDRVQKV